MDGNMWGKLIHGISRDLAPLLLPFVGRMESTKVDGLTKLQKKKEKKSDILWLPLNTRRKDERYREIEIGRSLLLVKFVKRSLNAVDLTRNDRKVDGIVMKRDWLSTSRWQSSHLASNESRIRRLSLARYSKACGETLMRRSIPRGTESRTFSARLPGS